MTNDEIIKMARECGHYGDCSNCPHYPARLNQKDDCTSIFAKYISTRSNKPPQDKITQEDLQPLIKEITAFLRAVTPKIVSYLNSCSQGETSDES